MSFFDLTRILFATHFVLGVPLALQYLPFLIFNPILAVVTEPDLSLSAAIRSVSFGGLIVFWYFVWYGSIVFAIYRRFPIVSIRLFSTLLVVVYGGWVGFLSAQSGVTWDQAMENPLYPVTIAVMLILGLCGITVLPGLKIASDAEEQRYLEQRDRQLDELNPCRPAERRPGPTDEP